MHGIDYLLTWNCTHINNVHKEHEIAAVGQEESCIVREEPPEK